MGERYPDNDCPTVALLPWGNVMEDFLDTIGVSLEAFCKEFTGSWMFGYVDALRQVGVRTVVICVSARVVAPSRFTHVPTGASICVLPVPRIYRHLRRKMVNPYGRTIRQMSRMRGIALRSQKQCCSPAFPARNSIDSKPDIRGLIARHCSWSASMSRWAGKQMPKLNWT